MINMYTFNKLYFWFVNQRISSLFFKCRIIISILITILTFFPELNVFSNNGQEIQKQLKFKHITIDNGLSNNHINSICQDKYGYIWLATRNGLNKYNGIEVIHYLYKSDDKNSILSNYINKIICDSNGNLWLGTDMGICTYDESIDGFVKFENNNLPVEINFVEDIAEDKDHNIWIASSSGLFSYNLGTNEINYFLNSSSKPNTLPSDSINCMLIDSKNNLWFSCYEKGLCYLDRQTERLNCFFHDPNNLKSLSDNRINIIFEDKSGQIWIGAYNGGLNNFNTEDSTFTRHIVDEHNTYSNRIRVIFEDNTGRFFIGTRGGLYLFDRETKKATLYANTNHKFSKLSNNSIVCSYINKNGGLWLGTYYGGVNYADLSSKPFIHYGWEENDIYFLNNSSVFAFTEDENNNLYIGTENGLNVLNRKTFTFKYFTHNPNIKNSISYNDIKALATDKYGNIWIGTNKGGINYFNPKTGIFIHYWHDPNNNRSLAYNKVYNLLVDRDNNLWVLTNKDWDKLPSQLSLLKSGSKNFIHFNNDFYNGIFENNEGNLLIGGINRFWIYYREKEEFRFIKNDTIIDRVQTIYEDEKGNIWIGSNKGLARYNPASGNFINFSQNKAYPIHDVYGILEDEEHNLWFSTNYGLIKMNNTLISPDSIQFRVYTKEDGIQSMQFNYNAFYKNKEGEMFFGGINGFNAFYPDKIKNNEYKPEIIISGFKVNNQEIKQGMQVYGKVIFNKPITQVKKVTLHHQIKVFTIKFDALHYSHPEKNKYKYRLKGFDPDESGWNYANIYNNSVTYTDLPAGQYTFKIYACNYDGVYCDVPATLSIEVLPPYWNTIWFKMVIIFIIVFSGVFFYQYRIIILRKQKKLLEEAVALRTEELRKSNFELQQQQNEIIAQNEEIQKQNEEIASTRDEIQDKNIQIEESYNKIKIISRFGQELTAVLDLKAINKMIYDYVSSLFDTSVFGIGIYNERTKSIVFSSLMEAGIRVPKFQSTLNDPTSCAAWCYKNQRPIMCNDFEKEYSNFITELKIRSSETPKSVIYLPLTVKNKKIGIITVQSYHVNAYTENDFQTLQTLASYIAISLDNAGAYEIVKKQKDALEKHQSQLENLVYDRTKDLEKAKIKAEESDKLKSAFLANLSHEIRTPLNAVIGFIDLLTKKEINETKRNHFYQIIKNNGYSLLKLINDIIDFAKIEAGQIEISISETEINTLLNEIYQTYAEEIKKINISEKKNLKIILNTPSDKQKFVLTDSLRLRQIFNNLIDNALKYTQKGYIELGYKYTERPDYITYFVKDTGIGIAKKNQEIIFERFRKIEETSEAYRGAGLGLSITKYLVERLGGEIWIESELKKGSTFFIRFPDKEITPFSKEKKQKREYMEELMPNWKNKKILVVEDETSNYLVIESMLEDTGIEVIWAKNGEKAYELFNNNMDSINIVLMDIKLPKINGMIVAKELKKIKPSIPIVAYTAYALPEEERTIRKASFNDYISKPIIQSKLIKTILSLMK